MSDMHAPTDDDAQTAGLAGGGRREYDTVKCPHCDEFDGATIHALASHIGVEHPEQGAPTYE